MKKFVIILTVAVMLCTGLWNACGLVSPPKATDHKVVGDGQGGVVIAWSEDGTIFAQRLDCEGNRPWGRRGIVVCQTLGPHYRHPPATAADGHGGAVFV